MITDMFRNIYAALIFFGKEFKSGVKVGFFKRLKMFSSGFLGESYVIYGLDKNDKKEFVSDYSRQNIRVNEPYESVLDDKLLFHDFFRQYLPVAKISGLIQDGHFFSMDEPGKSLEEIVDNELNHAGQFILKSTRGGGGKSVVAIRKMNGSYLWNDKEVNQSILFKKMYEQHNYICCRFAKQAPYSEKIFSKSVNTIRLLTLFDDAKNEAFISLAVHRFGRKESKPVDNWKKGGLSALIDLETGVLGKAVSYPVNRRQLQWHTHHPDSLNKIEGVQVPHWNNIKKELTEAADKVPYLKMIGWDVVVTKENFIVLEGNNVSDFNLLQVHQPLLKDPKTKTFFNYHNIQS